MAGFNIGSLAGGFAQGIGIGNTINDLINQDQIAKIRAQGIAEARAAQAQGTPQVVDGQALSSTPQASGIPGAVAAPVNTDLAQFGQPQMLSAGNGVSTAPVAQPMTSNTSQLSSTPIASADPNLPAAQGITIKGDKRYRVGNTSFDSIEEANKHASSQAPDMDTLMREKLAPRMREAYLAQGDIGKAEAWTQWAQDGEGKAKMKNWATAFTAAQAGDYDAAAKSLQKMHGELADGRTIESTEPVKDKSGKTTGFNINYKDDNTGEVKSQFVDRDTLVEQGLSALSPQAMFEQSYKAKTSADNIRAKAAVDNENDARTARRDEVKLAAVAKREDKRLASNQAHDLTLEEVKHNNRITEKQVENDADLASYAPKEKAKITAHITALKDSGLYSDDEVKAIVAAKYNGGGEFKKGTSPKERRDMVSMKLLDNPVYVSAPAAKQAEMRRQALTMFPDTEDDAPSKPSSRAPAAAVKPTSGLMIYDPVSKQMVPATRR